MSVVVACSGALPGHRYEQHEITGMLESVFPDPDDVQLLRKVHENAGVGVRHLALPLESYLELDGFGSANDAYLEHALELSQRAAADALAAAGLTAGDVDLVVSVSTTGIAAPSLEARFATRVGLREDVKRMPLFGLGCVGGAGGLARVHDYLRGAPDDVALLVAVEMCSLTMQRGDRSAANLVATSLFGDGAAAVVLAGERRARDLDAAARVLDSRSHLYPDTEGAMGWEVGGSGLRIVLREDVPELARTHLEGDARALLRPHELTVGDVASWISHPGGPKVIEAIVEALGLEDEALRGTWDSLAQVGNLSSASVLFVLRDAIAAGPPRGWPAVLLALGPGFSSELVLLEWL